jgi:hypothetical protein
VTRTLTLVANSPTALQVIEFIRPERWYRPSK